MHGFPARKLKRKSSRVKVIYTPHGGAYIILRTGRWVDSMFIAERKLLP